MVRKKPVLIIPGWEIPKITPAALAQGVGFVTDYFGEVLVKLRDEDFQPLVRGLKWAPGMTRRDVVAVERISSGLIKLLYPHGRLSDAELGEAAALVCEMRQRVHHQLCEIAPGEFKPRTIGFEGMADHTAPDLRGPVGETLPATIASTVRPSSAQSPGWPSSCATESPSPVT